MSFEPQRQTARAALAAQQARLPASAAREANARAVASGEATLVATGQQVGLFGGPLYTFYKAATAVQQARARAAQSGRACAPLFWMASEDHDFDEIAACAVDAKLTTRIEAAAGEAHVPVAHRRLGPSVTACLAALERALDGLPHADETMSLLAGAYRSERSPAEAFAALLGALFADHGLLVLDPRDEAIAAAAAPVYRACLAQAEPLAAALARRGVELAGDDGHAPVHVRAGAPLFFFHPDGARGPRYRLEPGDAGARYRLVGRDGGVSRQQLEQTLERDPLCFSSSVLLRPLLQDALLGIDVTVAGPGEAAYLAQTTPLYEALDVAASEVVRRASFRLIEPEVAAALEALGLSARELDELDNGALTHHLARRAVSEGAPLDPDVLADAVLARAEAEIGAFAERAAPLIARSPERAAAEAGLRKTRASLRRSLDKLASRYRRALAASDATASAQLALARDALRPGGAPQERVFALPRYLARYGPTVLTETVLEAIADPRGGQTLDLYLDEHLDP